MAIKGILEINDILNEYSNDIQEAITTTAESIAKDGVSELKITSPKRTGKYRRGWRVKTEKGKGFVECVIHNATSYQLTHLLEKPHSDRTGTRTIKPKVHIAPVEQQCVSKFEKDVENIIKNGG